MLLRSTLILLFVTFLVFVSAGGRKRPKKVSREDVLKNGRMDVAMKSRDHHFDPVEQGECPDGWKDGGSVGLGCVYADLRDVNINETTAETVCKDFGEGGRLVEIFK